MNKAFWAAVRLVLIDSLKGDTVVENLSFEWNSRQIQHKKKSTKSMKPQYSTKRKALSLWSQENTAPHPPPKACDIYCLKQSSTTQFTTKETP